MLFLLITSTPDLILPIYNLHSKQKPGNSENRFSILAVEKTLSSPETEKKKFASYLEISRRSTSSISPLLKLVILIILILNRGLSFSSDESSCNSIVPNTSKRANQNQE